MPLIHQKELGDYAKRIFMAAGSDAQEAELVSEFLVRANLCGVDSHGVIRIPEYIKMVEEGRIRPSARARILKEKGVIATMDAQLAYGQVGGKAAMELAIKKAGEHGIGAVAMYNCNHTGRIAEYAIMAANKDMIGMFMVKALGSIVAPWGGRGRILSTNPLSFAIPAETEPPIVADFATSISAEGKVRVKYARGLKIPLGWVLDASGKPTDNPADLYNGGVLLPFGESKGYALNLLMEAVGGALSGGGILDDLKGTNGVFAEAIDVSFFSDAKEFKSRVDTMIKTIRKSPPAEGFKEVLLPGDPEAQEMKRRLASGIVVEEKTWDSIAEVAKRYQVNVPSV